jgi:hypothetical protein
MTSWTVDLREHGGHALRPPHRRRHSSRSTSPSPATRPNPRPRSSPDPDASGQSSSPASSRRGSPATENAAAACESSRSSPTPTPRPHPTAPALRLRLLLPASSCCSPDRAPLRRRVHPPAPRCRPRCPSRAPGRTFRLARASPRAPDRAKIPRPRAPPKPAGPLRTDPCPQIPTFGRFVTIGNSGFKQCGQSEHFERDPRPLFCAKPRRSSYQIWTTLTQRDGSYYEVCNGPCHARIS